MAPNIVVTCATALAVAVTAAGVHRSRRQRRWLSEVLCFWFDGDPDDLYEARWFVPAGTAAQAALDDEVRARFGAALVTAMGGGLGAWRRTPHGCVALIVLLDQMGRHAHREQRDLIDAADHRALEVCNELLSRGWDRELSVAQLVFALMPLRHQPTVARLEDVMCALRHSRPHSVARLAFRPAPPLVSRLQGTRQQAAHLRRRGEPAVAALRSAYSPPNASPAGGWRP